MPTSRTLCIACVLLVYCLCIACVLLVYCVCIGCVLVVYCLCIGWQVRDVLCGVLTCDEVQFQSLDGIKLPEGVSSAEQGLFDDYVDEASSLSPPFSEPGDLSDSLAAGEALPTDVIGSDDDASISGRLDNMEVDFNPS